jgi:predicted small secreted protein
MKNLKKSMALVAAIAMSASMLAGCNTTAGTGDETTAAGGEAATTAAATFAEVAETQPEARTDLVSTGKTFTIYRWDNETINMYNNYYAPSGRMPAGVDVYDAQTPGSQEYQLKLQTQLAADANAVDDALTVDIMALEMNYMAKYINSDFTMPLTELGMTKAEIDGITPYVTGAATSTDGIVKGVGYQNNPGVMFYRRSMAKEVLGTDDPGEVAALIPDMAAFEATAAKMKDAGYTMIAAYDDLFWPYANTADQPIVAIGSTTITIPQAYYDWADSMKTYLDNGWCNRYAAWTTDWIPEASGKTFCYFGAPWVNGVVIRGGTIDATTQEPTAAYGDWAVAKFPVATYWGGSWLFAGSNTDNAELVLDFMRYFTTDPVTVEAYGRGSGNLTVNEQANLNIAADASFGDPALGGQNPYAIYNELAQLIDPKVVAGTISEFGDLNEKWKPSAFEYASGNYTIEQAENEFYDVAIATYPELKRPA